MSSLRIADRVPRADGLAMSLRSTIDMLVRTLPPAPSGHPDDDEDRPSCLNVIASAIETEWYNGNMTRDACDRLLDVILSQR